MAYVQVDVDELRASPVEGGRLEMIVVRPGLDLREEPGEAELSVEEGLVGDDWSRRPSRRTPDRSPHPDCMLTLVNARFLDAVAGSRDRWSLAGDNLVVDLDLSVAALAVGQRLRIGEATVEITDQPHTGCLKFKERFGKDALAATATPEGRSLRLRGVYARVVEPGTIRVGDTITRVASPAVAPA